MVKSKIPKLYDDLYDWIDRGVLAEAIIRALWESDLPLKKGQAKLLWYRILEELPGLLASHASNKEVYERRWKKL